MFESSLLLSDDFCLQVFFSTLSWGWWCRCCILQLAIPSRGDLWAAESLIERLTYSKEMFKDKQDGRRTGKLKFLDGLRLVTCDPQMLTFILCVKEKTNKKDNTRILTRNDNLVSGTSICEWTSHRGVLGL